MFTLPQKVQLQLFIESDMVDEIDLVIPGRHVKTLTSASRLIKEYQFSNRQHYIDLKRHQGLDLEKDAALMSDLEKRESAKLGNLKTEGIIFVKAEWEGLGDQLPPARSETLFSLNEVEKNRYYYTKHEQHSILQEQKPIDLNDPRNEVLIKSIRQMKNDYLGRLLQHDTKFQLNDITSFRHMLLKARASDPKYAKIQIPQLNSELINGDISKYYLNWLEEVYRQETYKDYIDKKQQVQQNLMDNNEGLEMFVTDEVFDPNTLKRRQLIFDKINKRKKVSQSGLTANKQIQYDSIVDEYKLQDDKSLLEMLKGLLKFERPLKPVVKQRKEKALEYVKETKLMIHVIRGTDVPVRQSYFESYIDYLHAITDAPASEQQSAYQKLYFLKQVESFVEIRIVDLGTGEEMKKVTSVADGQYPEWNEMLEFIIEAKNKKAFTKEELEHSNVMIYFTLFDQEVHIDPVSKMREQRYIENRYLGSFKIPLTTILYSNKFEGVVRVNRPLVLQGYHVVKDELIFMS